MLMKWVCLVVVLVCLSSCHAVLIPDSTLGLSEVVWQPETTQIYIGSPSILKLQNCSNNLTGWIASHDLFGVGFNTAWPRNVSVYITHDEGITWALHATVPSAYWATLFNVGDSIYLLGTSTDRNGPVAIHGSKDCGLTWTTTILGDPTSAFNTGPTPVILSNGTLYRAVEHFRAPFVWGTDYEAVLVYADVNSDLLSNSSWKFTQPLAFNNSWMPASWNVSIPGYLEGNAVEGPDGEVYNILRFNSAPEQNLAAVLKLNKATNTLVFQQFITFFGGDMKFTIRRDTVTGLYISLANYYDRNVLTLNYSKDMLTWVQGITLLSDDTGFTPIYSAMFTGFQYVDWQIDGDNIFYCIRTAYRGANSMHNSNRLTVKWLYNFRSYL